jgi:hypothetical protein
MDRIGSGHLLSTSWQLLLLITILVTGCSGSGNSGAPATAQATGTLGAEQAVGERLFMETRFAQAFKAFVDAGGDVNDPNAGDPGVDSVEAPEPFSPCQFPHWQPEPPMTSPPPNSIPQRVNASGRFHRTRPVSQI